MRSHQNSWELFWNWNYKRYTLYPGISGHENEGLAEMELRRLALVLVGSPPEFPEEWERLRGVQKYLRDRFGESPSDDSDSEAPSVQYWISSYEPNIKQACSEQWAIISINTIKRLATFVPGGLGKGTPNWAGRYLESLQEKGRSAGTRNRNLAICNRFFKWCVATRRIAENPFADIENLKVPDIEEIAYCTPPERERVLKAAAATGGADLMAVSIALYAGLRREEVFRLQWEDVNIETKRMRLCCPVNPNETGQASEVIGKRTFIQTAAELQGMPAQLAEFECKLKKAKRKERKAELSAQIDKIKRRPPQTPDGGECIPAERIRWNAWRHTFATLRVQAGVTLDKVSSWMGNTPDICRTHYAQFMPRDSYDEDIDK